MESLLLLIPYLEAVVMTMVVVVVGGDCLGQSRPFTTIFSAAEPLGELFPLPTPQASLWCRRTRLHSHFTSIGCALLF